jgi:hypothetical protein
VEDRVNQGVVSMPALVGQSSRETTMSLATDAIDVSRGLHAAYANERLEEVIRAIAEDALNPSQTEVPPWRDEARFEEDLRAAVHEITEATTVLLTAELSNLLETAPPRIAVRLVAGPRFIDNP